MLARNDDFHPPDWWALSPEQRDCFVSEVFARAEVERARAFRAFFRALLLTWPKAIVLTAFRAAAKAWAAYRVWQERRRAIAELRALNDSDLKDIGLLRSEIESVIYGYGRDTTRQPRGARPSNVTIAARPAEPKRTAA